MPCSKHRTSHSPLKDCGQRDHRHQNEGWNRTRLLWEASAELLFLALLYCLHSAYRSVTTASFLLDKELLFICYWLSLFPKEIQRTWQLVNKYLLECEDSILPKFCKHPLVLKGRLASALSWPGIVQEILISPFYLTVYCSAILNTASQCWIVSWLSDLSPRLLNITKSNNQYKHYSTEELAFLRWLNEFNFPSPSAIPTNNLFLVSPCICIAM